MEISYWIGCQSPYDVESLDKGMLDGVGFILRYVVMWFFFFNFHPKQSTCMVTAKQTVLIIIIIKLTTPTMVSFWQTLPSVFQSSIPKVSSDRDIGCHYKSPRTKSSSSDSSRMPKTITNIPSTLIIELQVNYEILNPEHSVAHHQHTPVFDPLAIILTILFCIEF